jgi:carbonic anhydrase/acetyltransferase-like protein (isoleucine patch superfamily)
MIKNNKIFFAVATATLVTIGGLYAAIPIQNLLLPAVEAQSQTNMASTNMNSSNNNNNNNNNNTNQWPNIHPNVRTNFNQNVTFPNIEDTAFIHPFAVVIGDCYIGNMVMMSPTAVCRGDEGTPIHIGDFSNIQDGVLIHDLQTTTDIKNFDQRLFNEEGERISINDSRTVQEGEYSVFVGNGSSLAHDAMIHGPAWIGNDTFIGMKTIVYNAKVGNNVAVGISSVITNGVEIPDNKFVPPGSVITSQEQANNLPDRIGTPFEEYNKGVVDVNVKLAEGYSSQEELEKMIIEREAQMELQGLETTMMPNNSSSATQ